MVAFAAPGEMPKYGAVGTHGIRGPGTKATDRPLLPVNGEYKFVDEYNEKTATGTLVAK